MSYRLPILLITLIKRDRTQNFNYLYVDVYLYVTYFKLWTTKIFKVIMNNHILYLWFIFFPYEFLALEYLTIKFWLNKKYIIYLIIFYFYNMIFLNNEIAMLFSVSWHSCQLFVYQVWGILVQHSFIEKP